MWKKICSEYWKVNSDNLENQFCNSGSFSMAMRLKYKDKIDDPNHHWNTSPGETSPALNRRRFTDFQEYMSECEVMNKKSESDVEASHKKKRTKKRKKKRTKKKRKKTRKKQKIQKIQKRQKSLKIKKR